MSNQINSTVEITHANIMNRLDSIEDCIKVVNTVDNGYREQQLRKIIQLEFNALYEDYTEHSGSMLLRYYENQDMSSDYFSFISTENIAARLNQCMQYIGECCKIIETCDEKSPLIVKIEKYQKRFNRTPVYEQSAYVHDYETCTCGNKMNTTLNSNEIVCYQCGEIKIVHNDSTEDTIFGRRDDRGIKHGKYDPSRRCKFWIERIQGKENADISKDCTDAVTTCIDRDHLSNSDIILCMQIREYLKETGFTVYNDHVTLIRKIITGYSPPYLTEDELKILYHIFNKVITIFDDIKPAKKYNSPYYPYIVGKILHHILPNGQRKRRILECIHMQSNTTLVANDILMKTICKRVSDIEYTPTIKSDFTIFR